MSTTDTTRNASLEDLVTILKSQEARRHDIVVPASQVRAREGNFVVAGADVEITSDGVTNVNGSYRPTRHFDNQLATKLGIPPSYLAKLRAEAVDLYDQNVNGWLRGKSMRRVNGEVDVLREPDDRTFLVRALKDDSAGPAKAGVARALLSDRFGLIDNLDALTTVLAAIRELGVEIDIRRCDLSDTSMFVDVHAPAIQALAPTLLAGYRSPFSNPDIEAQRRHGSELDRWRDVAHREGQGYEPGTEPIVHAGFRISNCEVGGGAFMITPKLLVKVCRNGLVIPAMRVRHVHLGSKMEAGVVTWSDETRNKELEVIKSKTKDAVKTFLSPDFLNREIGKIEEKAGKKIEKPAEVVKVLGKQLNFSQEEQDSILNHFLLGGQSTAAGLVNAVTSVSQTIPDADRADELDNQALKVLELV